MMVDFYPISLSLGDHIKIKRKGSPHSHHCIYAGNGLVIHYWSPPGSSEKHQVRIDRLSEVLQGDAFEIVQNLRAIYSGSMALERAYERLGEEKYNFISNNCEDFINYCIVGEPYSAQVNLSAVLMFFGGITMMRVDVKNFKKIGACFVVAGTCIVLFNLLKTTPVSESPLAA